MRVAIVLALVVSLAVPAGGAEASCAFQGDRMAAIRSTPIVFVGVATANRHRGGYTRFRVEEVWNGPDLAPAVWVQGGQNQGPWPFNLVIATASSNDVDFERGGRYLVATEPESFRTSACSSGQDFDEQLRAAAPAVVRQPVSGGLKGLTPPPSNAVLNTLAIAAIVGGLVVRRVRRKRRVRPVGA